MSIKRVGWIGLGAMGVPMARHVRNAGFELLVWSRSGIVPEGLEVDGQAATPEALAPSCDAIVTMIGGPSDVEALWGRLLDAAKPGQTFIDATTSSPDIAATLAVRAAELEVAAVDAPVTGGTRGADAGTLTSLIGGEIEHVAKARPVIETYSKVIQRFGPAGCGQRAKASNQVAAAGVMQGIAEALALAKAGRLPLETVLETLGTGTARSYLLEAYGAKILASDNTPAFALRHFIKDLKVAEATGRQEGLELPGAASTRSLYQRLDAAGRGDDGIQALIDALDLD